MAHGSQPRMTLRLRMVLQVMLAESAREMHGLEICKAACLPSGSIHSILARLEHHGWAESRWEDIAPGEEHGARRRYYHLTVDGGESARAALERSYFRVPAHGNAQKSRLIPRLTGGA
jgi:DNA-binding PadR family transcriptional regulator